MAEAILYGIAEEVLKNLGSKALNEVALAWGFKPRLEQLKNTILTIKDVLLDAEDRQADSHAVRRWLQRLTTTVYAADNLFDEVATVASRQQLTGRNTMSKEVHAFFSNSNQIAFAFKISRKIKRIRQELDDIVKDGTQFNFVRYSHEEGRLMNKRRDQSYSFVDAEEVIGRDGDKKAILDLLFASNSSSDSNPVGDDHEREKLPVIPIVGIGGLGKTTLVQLIYNDPQVDEYFELKLWICVSDVFDIKGITEKILMSTTNTNTQNLEMEQLQRRLRKEISNKKYLLVLDDVWNENREEWLKLRALLRIGRIGSKILVTTRSRKVAKIMGTVPFCELQGLSEEKSWELFEKVAFEPGQAQQRPHLVKFGKEIVSKCANVPLAIRTLGSLLYGEDEKKWLSFKDKSFAKIAQDQSDIMNILKLSYHHLWSPLKNCFAYCALFPKDYEFQKDMLIDLWMAEGFIIIAADDSLSLEELAEEYFLTLLQRCFFQDVKRNELGGIKSCKMHDLMHDLAQEVAGVNYKAANLVERNFDEKTLHLSFAYRLTASWEVSNWMLNLKQLRTFLIPEQLKDGSPFHESICQQLILKFRYLRVLDLHKLGVKILPVVIGKLIHLRYLDLSETCIEELPDSVTELQNLQTLKLVGCCNLRTLPTGIRKLTNLRSLDVRHDLFKDNLTHMPSGIGELTLLYKLPRFIVNHKHYPEICYESTSTAKLSDLKNLNNLGGVLHIQIEAKVKDTMSEAEEANLTYKHRLTELSVSFGGYCEDVDGNCNHDEAVLEHLKPHPNLRKLNIECYEGQMLPSWAMMDNLCISLPNLVEIQLWNFKSCWEVPVFSQLSFLKRLSLDGLERVEYMESGGNNLPSSSSSTSKKTLFFPSLQELFLRNMYSLKGWWKEDVEAIACNKDTFEASYHRSGQWLSARSFSKLSKLSIIGCRDLILLPLCHNVETLSLLDTNKALSVLKMATSTSSSSRSDLKLKKLMIDNVEDLGSLQKQGLSHLSVWEDNKLVNTQSLGEVFARLSSSLRSLAISDTHSLISISKGLEHLTTLERLSLVNCKELDLSPNEQHLEDEDGMPWKAFKGNLNRLTLSKIPKLTGLPRGLQHLTNLRSFHISSLKNLIELPEWINCLSSLEFMSLLACPKLTYLPEAFCKLTSLNDLRITRCPGLTERCRGPNGSEWPKIQHIPILVLLQD